MIELRLLEYFKTIVEEGSFTKAANKLHITQPTLSRQIRDLEEHYHLKFIDRSSNPLIITEDGMNLYHKARQILELSEKLDQDLNSGNEIEGTIDIGAVESAGAEAVYYDLMDLLKKYPNINFNFYHSDSDDIKEKLDKEILDFGILTEPVELSHYQYIKLPEQDKWYILVSKESKLAERESLDWESLTDQPLLISKRFAQYREFPEFFNSETKNFNILATYSLFSNAVYFVENNLAVAPCIGAVHSIKNNDKVKMIPLKPEFKTGSFLVRKKNQTLNRPAQTIFKELNAKINKRYALKA